MSACELDQVFTEGVTGSAQAGATFDKSKVIVVSGGVMGVVGARALKHRRTTSGVVVAMAAASLAVAGCGGGQASTGARASDVASFIPAGSPVYIELSTDLGGKQWTQTVELAKRFPGYGKLVAKVTDQLANEKIDFQGQIKPLLGSSAAVGVLDIKGLAKRDPAPSVVGAIDLADGKDAEFLTLIQGGKDPAKKVGRHDGVDLYGDSDATFAVLDGTILVSDTQERVNRAIDAHRGGTSQTMAGSTKLKAAFSELPDEVLAQGFIDVGALVRIAGASGGEAIAKQLKNSGIGADAVAGLSVSAEPDGVRIKAVGLGLGQSAGMTEPFTPKLVDKVPADAVAYLGFKNAFALGEQIIKQVGGQDPEAKKALSQASLALPLLGINLDDVKGLTSLEHAVVVTKGAKFPGVVAALEVADPARAVATLDALRKSAPALLEKSGTKIPAFAKVALANGVTGWQSAITPEAGVVYGVDGNLALIGTLPEAVKQVQSPVSKLTDDPAYQAAIRQMPSKVDGLVWINGEELLTALDAAGVLKRAPTEVIANLRPLKNLAAWTTGGEKPTFEAFLTVK